MPQPVYVKSRVPEGASGEWAVERFELPPPPDGVRDDRPRWARSRPGRYTRLSRGATVFMTDGHEEWWTQRRAIAEACRRGGHVLVTGLGLGVVVESMLRTPGSRVERVTVLEASADVIRLVAPHLLAAHGDRLEILHADAFAWRPPADAHYTVVWHDIWPNPYAAANAAEMDRLEARFADRCDWQGVWAREFIVAGPRATAPCAGEMGAA